MSIQGHLPLSFFGKDIMRRDKGIQLELFSLFKGDPEKPPPSTHIDNGKPGLRLSLFDIPAKGSPTERPSRAIINGRSTENCLRFYSRRLVPSSWHSDFVDNIARGHHYIETIGRLSDFRARIQHHLKKNQHDPTSDLERQWLEIGREQELLYTRYSGEGGLPISIELVQAQLNFLKEYHPAKEQRELLLSGLSHYLNQPLPDNTVPFIEMMKSQVEDLSSGEISNERIELFLKLLNEVKASLPSSSHIDVGNLSSVEGNGAYFSPEQFQELYRLVPLTSVDGQEINVLEPSSGKGSLIRPMIHQPGMLVVANDLNPISAEITELTTMVNASGMVDTCSRLTPGAITNNCIVTRSHVFDLWDTLPNEMFDVLISNPPFISAQAKAAMKKKLNGLGLKAKNGGFSLTEFTRKILPMKLRVGGLSIMITSARASNFKRVTHGNGLVSHPVMVLALSGQPFSMNHANLVPISMSAYSFEDGRMTEKRQIKAECFITMNVVAPTRVIAGKNSAFSDSEIIHLDYHDLPEFTRHCLHAGQWSDLDQRVVGPSMQMLQSANQLRVFTMMKAAVQTVMTGKIQNAKRAFAAGEAKRLEKKLAEINRTPFHHIRSFADIYTWIGKIGTGCDFPIQTAIGHILRHNPLRKFRAKQETKANLPKIEKTLNRAFRSMLSTKYRFFSRCFLLSAIHPLRANIVIRGLYGPFTSDCFSTDHPLLNRVPYPFSLYLLKEAEIVRILQRFPPIEQKDVLDRLWEKSYSLNHHVEWFNRLGREAESIFKTLLGTAWYRDLSEGVLPERSAIKLLTTQRNALCRAIGGILSSIVRHDGKNLQARNKAMAEIDLHEKQRTFDHYVRTFTDKPITALRIQNLIIKTRQHVTDLQSGINVLEASKRPTRRLRKIRPLNTVH